MSLTISSVTSWIQNNYSSKNLWQPYRIFNKIYSRELNIKAHMNTYKIKQPASYEQLEYLCVCAKLLHSHVWLFATAWTVALQAPLSMGFSRQEYWRGLPGPPPGDLADPGIEPVSLMSPSLAGRFFTISASWEARLYEKMNYTSIKT